MSGASTGRHRRHGGSTRPRSNRARWLTALVILGVGTLQVAVMTANAATTSGVGGVEPATARAAATTSATAPPPTTPTTTAAPSPPTPAGSAPAGDCAAALAYLAAHQAPGFDDVCGPHSAYGHFGVACWNRAPMCPDGQRFIHIVCPLPFVYMNEAHNSWTLLGQRSGIDPYGQGDAAEQQACSRLR